MTLSGEEPDPFGGGRLAARALLASLAFRVRHAWQDAPPGFADFAAGGDARTPGELLDHLVELLRFAATALPAGANADPGDAGRAGIAANEAALAAFDAACRRLDRALRDGAPAGGRLDPAAMLRGPLADALTHAGQLTLLRRLAGRPVEPVSYWRVAMPSVEVDD